MTDSIRLAVVGAAGRMGSRILQLAHERHQLDVSVAVTGPDDVTISRDGIRTTDVSDRFDDCDVAIDFSTPGGFAAALDQCVADGIPFVSGTTGLGADQDRRLDEAASSIPVLHAANFSVGVNLVEHLVELASGALADWDAEVFEAHHRHKVDAPSGTALYLGEAAARGRQQQLEDVATWSRHGHTGARTDDEIGFQVVRGGSIVGEHTVFFCGEGERIELTHRAQDRDIFVLGALRAARWIVQKPAGRYTMKDLLFR